MTYNCADSFKAKDIWYWVSVLNFRIQAKYRQMLLMTCAVSKEFKKVAEDRTKFKQIKRQLKALGFDNEYAGQMTDALNNACRVFSHFEKIQESLRACPGIDIRRLSLLLLYFG